MSASNSQTKSTDEAKGNSVSLKTFLNYGKADIFGYKKENKNGVDMVNKVWCLICSRNKEALIKSDECKGQAKKAMMKYIDGTNFVTSHTLKRHLESKVHLLAIKTEQRKPAEERLPESSKSAPSTPYTPRIDVALKSASFDLYKKMFNTAYELAKTPTMPLKHFKVLCEVQRKNP